jgi:hypothetical protein
MSPQPVLTNFGQKYYDAMAPLAVYDPVKAWSLAYFCNAVSLMFDDIDQLVEDQDDGTLGWGIIMNPDTAPDEWLDWLGQFIGVDTTRVIDPTNARTLIRGHQGFYRGTATSMVEAAQASSGMYNLRRVFVDERYGGDAWQLRVRTYIGDTSDPDAVLAALLSQKPAGIVLTYVVVMGQNYFEAKGRLPGSQTYTDMKNYYTDYAAMRDHAPGP